MKKNILLLVLLISTSIVFSQKKDKIKGSKIVTLEQKEIGDFDALEVSDDVEVFLVKGAKCGIEIEADDNIHDAIGIDLTGTTLRLSKVKQVSSYKKFSVRINYTESFKLISAKNEAIITALADINLNEISIRLNDESKFFGNIKSKVVSIESTDKAKAELNIKSEKTSLRLSKNTTIKTLVSANELITDLYQKATATLEGDVTDFRLRVDNNATATCKKLIAKNITLVAEASSTTAINATNTISIDASGKSDIQLFGDAKIEMKRFADSAVLSKKPMK